jgi:DNA-binding PadR family transcriptional regulator
MKTISRREEQILVAIWSLKNQAYLLAIKNFLSQIMKTEWSVGAIHKPLMKLEKEGYVESFMGDASAKRGGRRKKIYKVTDLGLEALKSLKKEHDALWAEFSHVETL